MAITLRFGIGGILLRNIAGREESRADHSVGKKKGRKEDYNWQSFLSNKFLRVAVAPREVNEGASSRNTRLPKFEGENRGNNSQHHSAKLASPTPPALMGN